MQAPEEAQCIVQCTLFNIPEQFAAAMYFVDTTLPDPEQNLACDEVLLDMCEEGFDGEILRFWEPSTHFAVLGYGNRAAAEVDLNACRRRTIPVLRRYSGGGAVLQGPGCLNYSLILHIPPSGPLSTITGTTSFVLERNARAIQQLLSQPISFQGSGDLTIMERKFSGNAQRRKHRFLLFHGTFLLNFDIQLVQSVLRMPTRQPEYRMQRTHAEFMTNLFLRPETVKEALRATWEAVIALQALPETAIRRLAARRYADASWTFRH
jgi:lipoate---protein ligase